tara:strand:+ start:14998 stop:15285 length:288 start_codon:yes stop_codon:yes gene_type:complete
MHDAGGRKKMPTVEKKHKRREYQKKYYKQRMEDLNEIAVKALKYDKSKNDLNDCKKEVNDLEKEVKNLRLQYMKDITACDKQLQSVMNKIEKIKK